MTTVEKYFGKFFGAATVVPSKIEFECHACGRKLRTSSDHSGQRAFCPTCGRAVEVPIQTVYVETSRPGRAGLPAVATAGDRLPAKNRSRFATWWPLLLPFACAAALAGFAFFYMRGNDATIAPPAAAASKADDAVPERPFDQLVEDGAQAIGIGHDRQSVIDVLSERFGCAFSASIAGDGRELYQTRIAGIAVMLWGPEDNLSAISIIGAFEGEYGTVTGMVLREILEITTPSWPVEERADWFSQASLVSGTTDISTRHDGIKVSVVSSPIEDTTLRIISFRNSAEE